eukprot:TRINITY_DN7378_c0_g2_i1.p1 TRINITY_DN7378_c0_g2~~TRINITY_DN7378_c0_g2_i1.p1  ORF type:complete len:541 (-),score=162.96 TRINITY_DN7378_c0_g2_i1:666-2288(-)
MDSPPSDNPSDAPNGGEEKDQASNGNASPPRSPRSPPKSNDAKKKERKSVTIPTSPIDEPNDDKRDTKERPGSPKSDPVLRKSGFMDSDEIKLSDSGKETTGKNRKELKKSGTKGSFYYSDKSGDEMTKKKTRSRPLDFKRNQIGQIIYKGHPSWILMQNIQTGIRHYVGKNGEVMDPAMLKAVENIESSPLFFNSPSVLRFPSEGSQETQPHKTGLFKFKDYCPLVFRHLRQKFGIDPADYLVSLCHALDDGTNALRELPTPGKSGSLFFFSHDMRYILKTIPKDEAKLLRFLLPAYYKHMMENTDTLLPKFFGLHRVKPHKGRQVRFVIMGNVFNTTKKIHQRFDLKGSTLGRAVSEQEKTSFKENVTFKDIDFKNMSMKFKLGPRKEKFIKQLESDCKLLEKLNIMDYSLLVGIHYCDKNNGNDCAPACFDDAERLEKEQEENRKKAKQKKKEQTTNGKQEEPIGGGDIHIELPDDQVEKKPNKKRRNKRQMENKKSQLEAEIFTLNYPMIKLKRKFKLKMEKSRKSRRNLRLHLLC